MCMLTESDSGIVAHHGMFYTVLSVRRLGVGVMIDLSIPHSTPAEHGNSGRIKQHSHNKTKTFKIWPDRSGERKNLSGPFPKKSHVTPLLLCEL